MFVVVSRDMCSRATQKNSLQFFLINDISFSFLRLFYLKQIHNFSLFDLEAWIKYVHHIWIKTIKCLKLYFSRLGSLGKYFLRQKNHWFISRILFIFKIEIGPRCCWGFIPHNAMFHDTFDKLTTIRKLIREEV